FRPSLRDDSIDPTAARQIAKIRGDLLRISRRLRAPSSILHPLSSSPHLVEQSLLKLPLLAYPDRVCRRRADSARAAMVGGVGVRLAPESAVTQAEFFLPLDARHDPRSQTTEALVPIASPLRPAWPAQ